MGGAAVRSLIREWSGDSLITASRWLNKLPEGAARDAGIVAIVESVAPFDIDAARQWAASAHTEDARQQALRTIERNQ
jgi:hypothetical protein